MDSHLGLITYYYLILYIHTTYHSMCLTFKQGNNHYSYKYIFAKLSKTSVDSFFFSAFPGVAVCSALPEETAAAPGTTQQPAEVQRQAENTQLTQTEEAICLLSQGSGQAAARQQVCPGSSEAQTVVTT